VGEEKRKKKIIHNPSACPNTYPLIEQPTNQPCHEKKRKEETTTGIYAIQ